MLQSATGAKSSSAHSGPTFGECSVKLPTDQGQKCICKEQNSEWDTLHYNNLVCTSLDTSFHCSMPQREALCCSTSFIRCWTVSPITYTLSYPEVMFRIIKEKPHFSVSMRQKHLLQRNDVWMLEFPQQLQNKCYASEKCPYRPEMTTDNSLYTLEPYE